MSRNYQGDIQGKFWFAVQESTDPAFFGAQSVREEGKTITYQTNDMNACLEGIERCKEELGDAIEKLQKLFQTSNGFTRQQVAEHLQVEELEALRVLKWYARLVLGTKMLASLLEFGRCNIEAEI